MINTKSLNQDISIHQSKIEISSVICNLKKLQNLRETLRNSINTRNNEEWGNDVKEINKIKQEIETILHKYSNEFSYLKKLKQKLNKRKRKRLWIKKRYEKIKKLKKQKLQNRLQLHDKINKWLKNEKEKNLQLIKKNEQKQQTEFLLTNITKNKYDASRFIQLLNSLKELREIRKKTISLHKNDLNEKNFTIKINQLINVWQNILNEYENEENSLRLILNDTNKTIDEQWMECLFGTYNKNETIQLRSEQNLNDFLEIRYAWDSYIVSEDSPHGSSIPIGWVMPKENPSNQWSIYRNPNNSVITESQQNFYE